jgi:hypothetical protein
MLFVTLCSFCDYRIQFYRGELDLPRPEGSSLFIAMKVISLFNLKPSVCLVNVDDDFHTFIRVRETDDRISALISLVPACNIVHQPTTPPRTTYSTM